MAQEHEFHNRFKQEQEKEILTNKHLKSAAFIFGGAKIHEKMSIQKRKKTRWSFFLYNEKKTIFGPAYQYGGGLAAGWRSYEILYWSLVRLMLWL